MLTEYIFNKTFERLVGPRDDSPMNNIKYYMCRIAVYYPDHAGSNWLPDGFLDMIHHINMEEILNASNL